VEGFLVGFADFDGIGGLGLGDAVVSDGIADKSVGILRGYRRMALGFVFMVAWFRRVSSILTRSTYELKRDYRAEGLCFFSLGFAEEVMVLEAHPVFRFVSEVAAELQAVLWGEQAAAGENVIEHLRADVEVGGELRLSQAVIV